MPFTPFTPHPAQPRELRKPERQLVRFLIFIALSCRLASGAGAAETAATPSIYIREFRVAGAKLVSQKEMGEAVYPYLGPGRNVQDVEEARDAIEKLYKEKGFQTVSVEIPQQAGKGGIVVLKVVENKVGRLRVHGSRYFSLSQIKKNAPSLAEGTVPNFNDITRDIVALNQWPDREITPTLKAGVEPGNRGYRPYGQG